MVWYGMVQYVCMHVGRFRGIIWGPIPWGGGNTGHGTIYIYIYNYMLYIYDYIIYLTILLYMIDMTMYDHNHIYICDYTWLCLYMTMLDYIDSLHIILVVLTILKNTLVNGKDDIPYVKWKIKAMFQTTNQVVMYIFNIIATIIIQNIDSLHVIINYKLLYEHY